MKTCTVQNPLSGLPRPVYWERLELERGRFQAVDLEGLFHRDRAGLWFERRNFPLAARAAVEGERGGPMELSIALESLARGGLPFDDVGRVADRVLAAGATSPGDLSLLLCALLGWFEARDRAGDAADAAALPACLRLLARVGAALREPAAPGPRPGAPATAPPPPSPAATGRATPGADRKGLGAPGPEPAPGLGAEETSARERGKDLADELARRLLGLLARRFPGEFAALPAALREALPTAWRPAAAPAGRTGGPPPASPPRYRESVKAYLGLCLPRGGTVGEGSDEFRLLVESLFQFDLFEAGVRDPDLSVFTDVAVIVRDLYETLVNRRVKDDFLAYLGERGRLAAFNAGCARLCRGEQKNLCQALSFVPNPERKLRPGEWSVFLRDLQRLGEEGVTCPRARHFLDFVRERHWNGLFLHSPRFADEVREVFRSGCLSRLVHHPRPGWDTYRDLRGLFERLSGLELAYWKAEGPVREKQFNRSAVFPLLLEPRMANAMA